MVGRVLLGPLVALPRVAWREELVCFPIVETTRGGRSLRVCHQRLLGNCWLFWATLLCHWWQWRYPKHVLKHLLLLALTNWQWFPNRVRVAGAT